MTVENFKKAMLNAPLEVLKLAESNLIKTGDNERLAVVKDIISSRASKPKKKEKETE